MDHSIDPDSRSAQIDMRFKSDLESKGKRNVDQLTWLVRVK